jgi:hypothetical protein
MSDVFDLGAELEQVVKQEQAATQPKAASELALAAGYGDAAEISQKNKANNLALDPERDEHTEEKPRLKAVKIVEDNFDSIDPVDIFGDTILTGKPEWPDDACPAPIINFARDEAERIGVVIEMIAFPAITCAAIVISDRFKIQPKKFDTRWTESPRLWAMIVSESGQKKTPCFKAAIEPVKEIEKNYYFQFQEEMADYTREKELFDEEKKAANKDGKELMITEPEKPVQKRFLADDITVEAFRRVLEHNDHGVGVAKDELAGWITSFDIYRNSKQGSKDRADYCELYQGGQKSFDRAEKGFTYVSNWSASIVGFIQPGPVRRTLGEITDDGMLARFLVCHGEREGRGKDRKPDYVAINTYHQTIKQLSELKPKDGEEEIFLFSDEAIKYREIIFSTCERVQILPDSSEALIAHLDKWEASFCRIALIYHIIEATAAGEYPTKYINENTAKMAAKLMIDFLLPNSIRFYHDTLDDGTRGSHPKWIAGYILSNHLDRITKRNIERSYKKLNQKYGTIVKTMETLYQSGWVEPDKYKKNGTVTGWKVNPKVHFKFAEKAKEEAARRAKERIKIQEAVETFRIA